MTSSRGPGRRGLRALRASAALGAIVVASAACGHSRPPGSERTATPLRVVSLHQFLDLEPDTTSPGVGRRMEVRGRLAICGDDGILRWNETRTAQLSVGGGGLGCDELQRVADSLRAVDAAGWREYERSASSGERATRSDAEEVRAERTGRMDG